MDEQKIKQQSRAGRAGSEEDPPRETRRRGEILETAILQAAWEELSDIGYTHLTIEGVAVRAKTNKAVIYRRWGNKAKLVVAALQRHLPKPLQNVPDTGNLRNDMLILLRGIAQTLKIVGAETIQGLMAEYLNKDLIASIPQIMHPGTESKSTTAMKTILKQAELRGEVRMENMNPRIISLPMDLLRYEILITHEPISDKTITEIVDDIFLPIVRV
jgi:AcrR family transcriptional regulator